MKYIIININYKGRLYSNFKYINQEFINVVTSEKISKLGSDGVPCIINIFDNIMTFYFFEWYPDNDHCFEIED